MVKKGKPENQQGSNLSLLLHVVASATSLLTVGLIFGFLYLTSIPPTLVAEAPEFSFSFGTLDSSGQQTKPGAQNELLALLKHPLQITYSTGSTTPSRDGVLPEFNEWLRSGSGEIILSEGDLNTIASMTLNLEESSNRAISEAEANGSSTYTAPKSINFRLRGTDLQLTSNLLVKTPFLTREVLFKTNGKIEIRSGSPTFIPQATYFNSLRVPPPIAASTGRALVNQLVKGFLANRQLPEPRRIEVKDSNLRIVL
ncbi:MAG: hypothetical protein ACFCU4_07750 [Puniceicoccaceae bacterium]